MATPTPPVGKPLRPKKNCLPPTDLDVASVGPSSGEKIGRGTDGRPPGRSSSDRVESCCGNAFRRRDSRSRRLFRLRQLMLTEIVSAMNNWLANRAWYLLARCLSGGPPALEIGLSSGRDLRKSRYASSAVVLLPQLFYDGDDALRRPRPRRRLRRTSSPGFISFPGGGLPEGIPSETSNGRGRAAEKTFSDRLNVHFLGGCLSKRDFPLLFAHYTYSLIFSWERHP